MGHESAVTCTGGPRHIRRSGEVQARQGRTMMLTVTETRHTAFRVDPGHRVIVLANRAPFRYQIGLDGRPSVLRTASGVVTALEPLLETRGGVWVASGVGDADRVY